MTEHLPRPWRAVLVVVAALFIGTSSVIAALPRPVVPVEEPPAPRSVDEGSPAAGGGCLLPLPLTAGNPSPALGRGADGLLLAYPQPLLPVPAQPPSPCVTELTLTLVVASASRGRPAGPSASFDGMVIPGAALESGYTTTVPAGSRGIGLAGLGDDWRLVDVACTCSDRAGATVASSLADGRTRGRVGRLTSYPGPVVPADQLRRGRVGSSACPSPAASPTEAVADASVAVPPAPITLGGMSGPAVVGPGAVTSQPGPVVPADEREGQSGTTPAAPERQPGSVSWSANGNVLIEDPDRAGGVFACTWTVEPDETLPREGRWRTIIGPVRVRCGGQRITVTDPQDPTPEVTWTLDVRAGGKRLVLNAGTPARIRVDRVSDDPLRYRGRRQQLTYRLDVISSERMDGVAVGRQRSGGRDCSATRRLEMSYLGE